MSKRKPLTNFGKIAHSLKFNGVLNIIELIFNRFGQSNKFRKKC